MNESFEWLAGLPTTWLPQENCNDCSNSRLLYSFYRSPFRYDFCSVGHHRWFGDVCQPVRRYATFPQWALALIAGGGTAAAMSYGISGNASCIYRHNWWFGESVGATTETAGEGIYVVPGISSTSNCIYRRFGARWIYRSCFRKKTLAEIAEF